MREWESEMREKPPTISLWEVSFFDGRTPDRQTDSLPDSPLIYKTEGDIPKRNKSEKSQFLSRNKVQAFFITVQFLVFP